MTQKRTAKPAPPTPIPHFRRGGHQPPHFKNCSAGPVLKLLPLDFCNKFYHLPCYIYRLFRRLSKILISAYFAGIFNFFSLFLYLCYHLAFSVLPLLISDVVTPLQTFRLSHRLCGLC